MSRPPPSALTETNPPSSLRSLSQRTVGAAIFSDAPWLISIVLLSSHSPGAVSLSRSGLFSFALSADSVTFWPPLRTILSPAWSNVAASPAGAGSAGAVACGGLAGAGLGDVRHVAAGATSRRTSASGVLLPHPVSRSPAAATRADSRRVSEVLDRMVCPSLNRSPAGSAAGAGSVHRSGADAGSAVPSRTSARMISGTPIAPSRLSGGRLRSLPVAAGPSCRGPPPGRAPGSWSARRVSRWRCSPRPSRRRP